MTMVLSDDRRRHPRVPLSEPVLVHAPELKLSYRHTALDLSVGGMFVETRHPFPLGQQVSFALLAHDDVPFIDGKAEVVSCLKTGRTGMGLRFTELPDESAALITSFVDAKLSVQLDNVS